MGMHGHSHSLPMLFFCFLPMSLHLMCNIGADQWRQIKTPAHVLTSFYNRLKFPIDQRTVSGIGMTRKAYPPCMFGEEKAPAGTRI
jgi:hypothetical protein